ncbi:hypothetical protein ScPMuIL_008359 [Solemya velum]
MVYKKFPSYIQNLVRFNFRRELQTPRSIASNPVDLRPPGFGTVFLLIRGHKKPGFGIADTGHRRMARKLEKGMEAEIKELFRLFDKNNDKSISSSELEKAMRYLGMSPTQQQVKEALKTLDKNDDGKIEYPEFFAFMQQELQGTTDIKDQEPTLRAAFRVFDRNGDGFVDAKELGAAMKKLGETLTDTEVEAMMREADVDGDGKINYEEFIRVWCETK